MNDTCGGVLPEAAHGPIAGSVISRRVRPAVSRAIVPVVLLSILFPSVRVCVSCVEKLAEKGAPVTVLPASPASKPTNPMPSNPGPIRSNIAPPWCVGGGAAGSVGSADCAQELRLTVKNNTVIAPMLRNQFLAFIRISSRRFFSLSKINVRICVRHQPDSLRRSVFAHQQVCENPVRAVTLRNRQPKRRQRRSRKRHSHNRPAFECCWIIRIRQRHKLLRIFVLVRFARSRFVPRCRCRSLRPRSRR